MPRLSLPEINGALQSSSDIFDIVDAQEALDADYGDSEYCLNLFEDEPYDDEPYIDSRVIEGYWVDEPYFWG